ncbi:3-dehydroquinate synthase [Pseudohalioglobus lutimaris]|uniref:3-dehydroquinate synthase n=1 Tax=Pseudohalioglobus lutimaris TaxID=1737061 RepID=A0A2N5X462_9GAMM|nr:3-dehydroquinate synthase [Pseudohalioglobus lutimaris]PLW69281.1 3-dehydroquinate synthase [Pseudohalioglobus lutimaris]
MHKLQVELGERSYPIYIGRELLADSALLAEHVVGTQVVIISNDTVAPLYLDRLRAALGERELVTEIILADGEQFKSMDTLNEIFDRVLTDRHSRSTTMIALGGGVVGDITGFAAACYQRGVKFVQVPTTLLSQVDSSVGGKTAVNHPLGKNMIGAFYQPQAVLIDINTLSSLPSREFAAGVAEVLKYGLICDAPFYRWLQEQMPKLLAREEAALAEAIERSCACKAEVVAADEREGGLRAILNLGHTFGHAIETAQGYGNWLHGEAVATGMLMAMELSARRGWIDREEVKGFRDLLLAVNLPVRPPSEMTPGQFLDLMGRDKKVLDGRLRLVLLKSMGEAVIVDDATESELTDLLEHFLKAA